MYIQKAEITNIKSIEKFEIEFKNPAGWHVLIGDNGSGKTTIVRSMALALVGAEESSGLRQNIRNWINTRNKSGKISLTIEINKKLDKVNTSLIISSTRDYLSRLCNYIEIIMSLEEKDVYETDKFYLNDKNAFIIGNLGLEAGLSGFFFVGYGPYRRFEGGSSEWEKIYNNKGFTSLAASLSIFDESVALTEPIRWLKDLNYKTLEKNKESKHTLENLKKLINSDDFLPHNSKLEKISSDGVFFKDGNGVEISVNQMSDGYRSILSLTFELIRQLVRVYGSEKVFKNIEKGEMFIDLPGVVLIDEIDAHLHPTWQTRIGNWFLKYFPNLQFIVTTHSPLVCRACEKGSIWKLAAPGSDEESGEVTGIDRERLIYGNVLDAYGTGVFGENTSISQDSNDMLNRLSELNVKSMMGLINDKENKELEELRAKFPTESAIKK